MRNQGGPEDSRRVFPTRVGLAPVNAPEPGTFDLLVPHEVAVGGHEFLDIGPSKHKPFCFFLLNSSYVIDLPNGGRSYIIGNIIHHGPHAENGVAVSYAAEGAKNTVQELYVVNNTYINERAASGSFLHVAGTPPVVRVINNIVIGTKTVLTGPGESTNNLVADPSGFVDAPHYDYRLTPRSPALGAGIDPGKAGDFSLAPTFYYRQPVGAVTRPVGEKLNIGACPVGGV